MEIKGDCDGLEKKSVSASSRHRAGAVRGKAWSRTAGSGLGDHLCLHGGQAAQSLGLTFLYSLHRVVVT